jgi:hypothetical protein
MPYNRVELSVVGFRLKKARRELEKIEAFLESQDRPDPSSMSARNRIIGEIADLMDQYSKLLEKGKRER